MTLEQIARMIYEFLAGLGMAPKDTQVGLSTAIPISETGYKTANDPKTRLPRVLLQRQDSTDEGTPGIVVMEDGWTCFSGELPWRDNASGASCVPTGIYRCRLYDSPRFGRPLYMLLAVPDRDHILIHPANYFGDDAKGKLAELDGCIALGRSFGVGTGGQKMLMDSRATVGAFMAGLGGREFELVIS